MLLELTFISIRIIILTYCLVLIIRPYIELRVRTLKLLLYSLISYYLAELFGFWFTVFGNNGGPLNSAEILDLLLSILIVTCILVTFFILRLFLEAFDNERIVTRRTITLGGLTLFLITGYILTSLIGIFSINDFIAERYSEDTDFQIVRGLWTVWGLFLFLCFVFLLSLIVGIYRNISNKIEISMDPDIRSVLERMRVAVLTVFVSSAVPLFLFQEIDTLFSQIFYTISAISILVFVRAYIKNGVHILLSRTYRRLIIVTKAGIPLYGYTFRSFESNTTNIQPFQEEILFSGILKAISSLISGFTGTDDDLLELVMKDVTILVEAIDQETAILLLTNKPNLAIRSKLQAMSAQVNNTFSKFPTNKIKGEEIAQLNNIVVTLFGSGEGPS